MFKLPNGSRLKTRTEPLHSRGKVQLACAGSWLQHAMLEPHVASAIYHKKNTMTHDLDLHSFGSDSHAARVLGAMDVV